MASRAAEVLPLAVGGRMLTTLPELAGAIGRGDLISREATALALNLALDQTGLFGADADFASAKLTSGLYSGHTPSQLLALLGAAGPGLLEAMQQMNGAFSNCDAEDYTADGEDGDTGWIDGDGDGVSVESDCDDTDPRVGPVLYEDGLEADAGYFDSTTQLDAGWIWDGQSALVTDGGQAVQIGAGAWENYVVIGKIAAHGTDVDCGFDCADSCGEYVPEDDCYTDYQAIALGLLTVTVTGSGIVTMQNSSPDYDVCLEGTGMWVGTGSQSVAVGDDVLSSALYRIPAGGSLPLYYGSWTTDNGVFQPYLNLPAMWCYQLGVNMAVGSAMTTSGAWLPEDMAELFNTETDTDGDGVEDHVDWAGGYGVQTQYNIWNYQASHAAITVGKLASAGAGTVDVTLTIENRGAVTAVTDVTDTLPRNWEVVSCDQPYTSGTDGDGLDTLSWNLTVDGCSGNCSVIDSEVIRCSIRSTLHVDQDIVELPAAWGSYYDGEDMEVSWSMQAAAFGYDWNDDGELICGSTDRWRVGLLARVSLDADQDEGFNGYRCALAQNSEEDCFDPGHFVQIGAFLDEAEDDFASECGDGCANPTFDQLARADHDGSLNVSAGDPALLYFFAYGEELTCEAYDLDKNLVAESRAQDARFEAGSAGMSTLNAYGDFDWIKVCGFTE